MKAYLITFLLLFSVFPALRAEVQQAGGAQKAQPKAYAVAPAEVESSQGLKPRPRNRPLNNLDWGNFLGVVSTIGALFSLSYAGNLFMTGEELFPDVAGTSEGYMIAAIFYGIIGSLFLLSALNNFLDWGIPLADIIYCLI